MAVELARLQGPAPVGHFVIREICLLRKEHLVR